MITIIHGDDSTKSRNYFTEQKSQHQNVITLQGANVTITEITQIFEGNELFTTEKNIFIEEFFSKRKTSKETAQILTIINNNQEISAVYFWESKNLTPAQIKQTAHAAVKQFKLPKTIFSLLDGLTPRNGSRAIRLFHDSLQDEDVQFCFSMVIRQFRLLLALSKPADTTIEEIKRMAFWQKTKLQKQAKLFSIDRLKEMYKKLFTIEYGVKTGKLSLSLEQAIDFFLIGL